MKKNHPFTVCGEKLAAPMHICCFFDSEDERYEIILPYIKEGLEDNDEVLNILESVSYHHHCDCLTKAGIKVEENLYNHQLKIFTADETYLKGGSFAADKMYKLLEDALADSKNSGFDSVRACGDMSWALRNVPGTDELIEYEARLNQLIENKPCSLICMYDINKFSGRTIADILATHPYVILNGKINKNPHYIDPIEFLPTLLKRKKHSLQTDH